GVGAKTAEKLAQLGIYTVADITRYPVRELERLFGTMGGSDLHRRALGIDNSQVHISHETKSVSHEWTYAKDTADEKTLRETLREQTQSIARQLGKLELFGSTVKLKLRWPDFSTISRQTTMRYPTDNAKEIEKAVLEIFLKYWKPGRKVRLLGVGVSNLTPPSKQLNLWDWNPKGFEKQERLEKALQELQSRYGDASVRHASALKEAN
ncbi:MAG TPA: hypothetical protein VLK33_04780, partial [Terriglobales bacterium]|nr:hypothetical protein [Terriglobales bacterium]